MFIYSNQKCNIRWVNAFSNTFNVQNGVRQGAVSSPVLFCIYIDNVIKLLLFPTIGCQIQGVCTGIWVYADNKTKLSHSRTGHHEILKTCENFAKATKLKFSTNMWIEKCKTKCLIYWINYLYIYLYVEGFDDYVITEMINMLCNEWWSMSPICA